MKMKLIISGIILTLLCLLGGCDDKLIGSTAGL